MDAIVLAGGLGTRLRGVVKDLPKPMAPVNGRPFLEYILDHFLESDIVRVVLAVGYRHEVIVEHFGNRYRRLELEYCVEPLPLGTGGSMCQAIALTSGECVLVTNGDTLFKADLQQLQGKHRTDRADATIAVRKVPDSGRYGAIEVAASGRVESFQEKSECREGFINGGIYVVNRDLFARFDLPNAFSFERDFLMNYVEDLHIAAMPSDGYFIDIGIPSDYQRAQSEVGHAA